MSQAVTTPLATRIVVGLGCLYVAQSVIGGVIFTGLPAVMRQHGASLNDIAIVFLTVLPWSFKFLWAPPMERLRVPRGGRRRTRRLVAGVGAFAVAGLIACALVGPTAGPALLVAMMVASFASATVDIACDGHAVESLAGRHRGWANAVQVGGAYLGSAIGAGLFLIIIDHLGWRTATFVMAGVLVALALPFLTTPDQGFVTAKEKPPQSLMTALRRREVRSGLLLVALYVIGQKWAMVLLGPMMIDAGLSLSTVGSLNAVGVMSLGLLGSLSGGYLVRRFGAFPVMLTALCVQTFVLAGLASFAFLRPAMPLLLGGLVLVAAGALALGVVALYSELMDRASPDQAGVDFTLFQSMDGLVSLIGWRLSAHFGDWLGYGACFAAGACLAFLSLSLIPMLGRPVALGGNQHSSS